MFTNNVSIEAGLRNGGPKQESRRGFSLIEVVLAIGIASFSLLVIFSLMSGGISTLQSSSKQIVETEIFNKIGAELEATPFYSDPSHTLTTGTDLLQTYAWGVSGTQGGSYAIYPPSSGARFPVYFDSEGNETTAANAIYTVTGSISAPGSVPSSWTGTGAMGELRTATIYIGFHQNPSPNPTTSGTIDNQRTFLLVNKGD